MLMYAYDLFSPHNCIATWSALTLLLSRINGNFNSYGIIINLLLLYDYIIFYFICYLSCVLRTGVNLVIGLWADNLSVT
jgi:hypothetical protein